jgi:hypothetical protein
LDPATDFQNFRRMVFHGFCLPDQARGFRRRDAIVVLPKGVISSNQRPREGCRPSGRDGDDCGDLPHRRDFCGEGGDEPAECNRSSRTCYAHTGEIRDPAIELATHPKKLAPIKDKLARNRLTTPLFDTELFTRHIESAYKKMYNRFQAGLPPDHIHVPP